MIRFYQCNTTRILASIAIFSVLLPDCMVQARGALRKAQPVVWDGEAGDMQWFNALNWDPNGLPGISSTVLIQLGGPVVALMQPIEIDSLNAQTGLTLDSSSLSIQNPTSINGLFVDGLAATIDSSSSTIDIQGTSFFNSATKWSGTGTTLNGDITALSGMAVLSGGDLTLAGNLSLGNSTFSQGINGRVTIAGNLDLQNASLFSAGNSSPIWIVDQGGSIGNSGPTTSDISDPLTIVSGDLTSDVGTLEIRGNYTISNGKATVTNFGSVRFTGPANGPTPNQIHMTEFSGDGLIEIQGAPTTIGSLTGRTTASVIGAEGVLLKNTVVIEDELSNTEKMTLFGVTLIGDVLNGDDGRLTAAGGVIECKASTAIKVETIVQSGGKILMTDDTRVDRTLRVNQGGILELNKWIVNVTFPPHVLAQVDIAGLLHMPAGGLSSDILIPLNILAGGSVLIEDRRLQLKAGGNMGNGTFTLSDTAASGFPTLGFNGSDQDTWVFETGLTLSKIGDRADLFFGNGFGLQPNMTINGDLTVNITGLLSNAKVRVPVITGDGTLINDGDLLIERPLVMNAKITNSGSLTLQSALTLAPIAQSSRISRNVQGGTVTQKNTLNLGNQSTVENHGSWVIPNSTVTQPLAGSDPDLSRFTNFGTYTANSGTSSISARFLNTDVGTVVADSAILSFSRAWDVDPVGRPLIGGSWKTLNNGLILIPNAPQGLIVNGANSKVTGDGTSQPWVENVETFEGGSTAELGDTVFNGPVEFDNADLVVQENATVGTVAPADILFNNSSTGTVNPGATLESGNDINVGNDNIDLPSVTDQLQGVLLIGVGPVNPPTIRAVTINVYASLTPIIDDTGTMIVDSDLVIHPTGKLNINLHTGGLSSNVNVSRTLTIDGSVQVTSLAGYTPTLGDSFVIAQVVGNIVSIPMRANGDAGVGLAFGLSISGTDVILSVVCKPDLTGDGIVDVLDFFEFIRLFNAGDPAADLTGNGIVDVLDFFEFIRLFDAGCA